MWYIIRFSLRGQLKQHKTTHAGGKRFECNFCLKSFSHKGHFNEHKRIHTGEKPFKCNECEKCFNRKELLKQHQKLTYQQFNGNTSVQAGNIQSNKYADKWKESLMCTFGDQVVIAKKETKTTNKTTNDQSKYTQPGVRGGLQPPQILGNSDFLGSKRKFGQSHFLKAFLCFFY